MTKIVVTIILAVCAVGCVFVWAMGPDMSAATETVRKDIHDSIENLIGKYKIKITKIDQAIEDCKSKTVLLAKQEANASVEHSYANNNLISIKDNLEKSKKSVLKLADLIEKGEDVQTSSGKTITIADLIKQAEIVKARHNTLKQRYEAVQKIVDTYKNIEDKSNRDRSNGQYTVKLLEEKRALLIAKVENLKSIKQLQVSEEDYQSVYQEASRLLDEVTMEVDKEVMFHEKLIEIGNNQTTIEDEINQLNQDSSDVVTDLRAIVE